MISGKYGSKACPFRSSTERATSVKWKKRRLLISTVFVYLCAPEWLRWLFAHFWKALCPFWSPGKTNSVSPRGLLASRPEVSWFMSHKPVRARVTNWDNLIKGYLVTQSLTAAAQRTTTRNSVRFWPREGRVNSFSPCDRAQQSSHDSVFLPQYDTSILTILPS